MEGFFEAVRCNSRLLVRDFEFPPGLEFEGSMELLLLASDKGNGQ